MIVHQEVWRDCRLLDERTGRRVRQEAEEVIGRIERNEPPFDEGWHRWRPGPSWSRPEPLDGWDDPAK